MKRALVERTPSHNVCIFCASRMLQRELFLQQHARRSPRRHFKSNTTTLKPPEAAAVAPLSDDLPSYPPPSRQQTFESSQPFSQAWVNQRAGRAGETENKTRATDGWADDGFADTIVMDEGVATSHDLVGRLPQVRKYHLLQNKGVATSGDSTGELLQPSPARRIDRDVPSELVRETKPQRRAKTWQMSRFRAGVIAVDKGGATSHNVVGTSSPPAPSRIRKCEVGKTSQEKYDNRQAWAQQAGRADSSVAKSVRSAAQAIEQARKVSAATPFSERLLPTSAIRSSHRDLSPPLNPRPSEEQQKDEIAGDSKQEIMLNGKHIPNPNSMEKEVKFRRFPAVSSLGDLPRHITLGGPSAATARQVLDSPSKEGMSKGRIDVRVVPQRKLQETRDGLRLPTSTSRINTKAKGDENTSPPDMLGKLRNSPDSAPVSTNAPKGLLATSDDISTPKSAIEDEDAPTYAWLVSPATKDGNKPEPVPLPVDDEQVPDYEWLLSSEVEPKDTSDREAPLFPIVEDEAILDSKATRVSAIEVEDAPDREAGSSSYGQFSSPQETSHSDNEWPDDHSDGLETSPELLSEEVASRELLSDEASLQKEPSEVGLPEAGAPEAGAPEAVSLEAGPPEAVVFKAGPSEIGQPVAGSPEESFSKKRPPEQEPSIEALHERFLPNNALLKANERTIDGLNVRLGSQLNGTPLGNIKWADADIERGFKAPNNETLSKKVKRADDQSTLATKLAFSDTPSKDYQRPEGRSNVSFKSTSSPEKEHSVFKRDSGHANLPTTRSKILPGKGSSEDDEWADDQSQAELEEPLMESPEADSWADDGPASMSKRDTANNGWNNLARLLSQHSSNESPKAHATKAFGSRDEARESNKVPDLQHAMSPGSQNVYGSQKGQPTSPKPKLDSHMPIPFQNGGVRRIMPSERSVPMIRKVTLEIPRDRQTISPTEPPAQTLDTPSDSRLDSLEPDLFCEDCGANISGSFGGCASCGSWKQPVRKSTSEDPSLNWAHVKRRSIPFQPPSPPQPANANLNMPERPEDRESLRREFSSDKLFVGFKDPAKSIPSGSPFRFVQSAEPDKAPPTKDETSHDPNQAEVQKARGVPDEPAQDAKKANLSEDLFKGLEEAEADVEDTTQHRKARLSAKDDEVEYSTAQVQRRPPRRQRSSRSEDDEDEMDDEDERPRRKKQGRKDKRPKQEAVAAPTPIYLPEFISIGNLAAALRVRAEAFTRKMEDLGFQETNNDHVLDAETAGLIAAEFNFEPYLDIGDSEDLVAQPIPEDVSSLPQRPPVITIMGHVDHGKTTLLDHLRKSSVAASEFGGITQHIGAFTVSMPSGRLFTFLDTPGHAAFLSMRERGANVTDIVVLVVAADDSVKPQTLEAIKHAKAANVPMIVAINKVDKPDADVERVKQDLARHSVDVEDFGGDTQVVCVSGKTGQGMDQLEENLGALADVIDMRADPAEVAEGWVLEASVKKAGRVATVLVRRGTIRTGTIVVAGTTWTKVRTLRNNAGVEIEHAGPGTPAEIDGWRDQPEAGDEVLEAPDEQKAKSVVDYRKEVKEQTRMAEDMQAVNETRRLEQQRRDALKAQLDAATGPLERKDRESALKALTDAGSGEASSSSTSTTSASPSSSPRRQQIPLLIKADVSGSAEALSDSLAALGNDEVSAQILYASVGAVSTSDVELAGTSGALVVAFNTAVEGNARWMADTMDVHVLEGNVIYRVIDEVKARLEEHLAPKVTSRVTGEAEVAMLFEIKGKKGKVVPVAGVKVKNGVLERGKKVRVLRGGEEVWSGSFSSIKHQKKDVTEMRKGGECGLGFEGFADSKVGDQVQCFEEVKEKRHL